MTLTSTASWGLDLMAPGVPRTPTNWAALCCPFVPPGKAITKKKYIGIRMMSLTSRWVTGCMCVYVRSVNEPELQEVLAGTPKRETLHCLKISQFLVKTV